MTEKILFLNFFCGLGSDGSLGSYIHNGIQYLLRRKKHVRKINQELTKLIEVKKPDICCFVEIKTTSELPKKLSGYPFHYKGNKYRSKFLRNMPVLRTNGNGFISKKSLDFKIFYLDDGWKNLVIELHLENKITLLFTHFSLQASVRQKQFANLLKIVHNRKRIVICGDFNIFHGLQEIQIFQKADFLLPKNNVQATFPAAHPRYILDFIIHTKDVHLLNYEVITDFKKSDHCPIFFELS